MELTAAKKSTKDLEQVNAAQASEKHELKSKILNLEENLSKANLDVTDMSNRMKTKDSALEELKATVYTLETCLKSTQEQHKADMANMTVHLKRAQYTVDGLTKQHQHTVGTAASLGKGLNKLRKDLANAKVRIGHWQGLADVRASEISGHKTMEASLRKTIAEDRATIESLKKDVAKIKCAGEMQVADLTTKLQFSEEKSAALSNMCAQNDFHIEAQKQDLADITDRLERSIHTSQQHLRRAEDAEKTLEELRSIQWEKDQERDRLSTQLTDSVRVQNNTQIRLDRHLSATNTFRTQLTTANATISRLQQDGERNERRRVEVSKRILRVSFVGSGMFVWCPCLSWF
ncbi:hypothetical protein HK102_002969 [Quaeritorhiza haematococci]|nr:hypothetical protein HK102_002969 [Quaeritorhiza haematococci]